MANRFALFISIPLLMLLTGCEPERATTPPTGAPTTMPPPATPQREEMVEDTLPPGEPAAGEAVPEPDPARPIVEGEGPGAPGTRPGPTAQ